MTARLAALAAAALVLGGWSCEEAVENAPAAAEPELVGVSGPGQAPVEPVLGHFPVLPGRAVIVDLRMPWPAGLDVELDGRRVGRGDATGAASFDYEVDRDRTVPEWRVTVSLPPGERSGPFTLDFRMVSVNPGHTGRERRSEPLTVHVRGSAERFRFDGSAVLDVDHPELGGRKRQDVSFQVDVDPGAGALALVSFPEIVVGPFDTGLGENTTTITRVGGGSGRFDAAGDVRLPIELHFEHSHVLAGDSRVSFDLTTDEVGVFDRWGRVAGSPVNPQTAAVELADVSTFRGGYLDGRRVRLEIRGRFS